MQGMNKINKGLSEINNKLKDGLIFCRKAYRILEYAQRSEEGIKAVRLQKGKINKFIKEVLPISRYVQMKYCPGRQINVMWIDGNQSYDAYLLSSGYLVEAGEVPREQFIEVTTAVHQNDYLCRQYFVEKGHSCGPNGTKMDKKTKEIISKPYIYAYREHADDFAAIIIERIGEKSKINYPENTILLIWCQLNHIFSESEWDYMVDKVKKAQVPNNFREKSLFDSNHRFFTTLYL